MNEKRKKMTINDLWIMDRPTEEQRNLAKNADIVDVINQIESRNETLAPLVWLNKLPVTVTGPEFEIITHAIVEFKNELDIDPFSPESPKKENFVICPGALTVQKLQKLDLEQILIKEQIEALKYIWFPNATKEQEDQQLSEEIIKIITEYIPRGICVCDLRVISIGHGNYYQQTQVFDMDIAKSEIIKKLTSQINNHLIKPENIEICLGHDPPQIRLLQAKYPVFVDTFKIGSQLLPNEQHSAYNYWCVMKDANEEKQAQKERLENKSHFVHIKVSAVAAIIVTDDEHLMIEDKPTPEQRMAAAHRIFTVKVSKILTQEQRLESSPDFMIALMIEKDTAHSTELIFNETPPDHTRFIHSDNEQEVFSNDDWDSWDDDDWSQSHNINDFNQMRMAITAPGIKQKFHFQTMIDQTEFDQYQSMFNVFNLSKQKQRLQIQKLVMENQTIEIKYGDATMKALETEARRLRKLLGDSASEALQMQWKKSEQELISRRTHRISKLQRQKEVQQQLKKEREKKQIAEKLIKLYCEKTYSPVFHETIQLRSDAAHQNGMVNMTIIIGINSSLNRLAKRRVSIQANTIERLLIMNYKQGVIKYKPDSYFHHDTAKMKKLICNLERTYRAKKEEELFSRVKSEKKDEFVQKYLQGEIGLHYGVTEILKFSNCLENKDHQENVPYNHLNATTSTNKIKYINHTDGSKQIMIIDKESKKIYITYQGVQDFQIATAITRTMNSFAAEDEKKKQKEAEDVEINDIEFNDIDIDIDVNDVEKEKQGAFRVEIKESIEDVTEIEPTLEMQDLINVTWNHEENNNNVKKWKTIIMNKEQSRVLRQHHQMAIPYKSLICTIERKKIMKAASDVNTYKSGWPETTFRNVLQRCNENRDNSSSI